MKYKGVVDKRINEWSLKERLHLINCLSKWSANLYIYGSLEWGHSIKPLTRGYIENFKTIEYACKANHLKLWAWMKPGDNRYLQHRCDREQFIENAQQHIDMGAHGFYLLMDDMHKRKSPEKYDQVHIQDAELQAQLIKELSKQLGDNFKGICGEQYHGNIPNDCADYWQSILNELPSDVSITWTGPKKWNRTLDTSDLPILTNPVLLWDNYFASDSKDPDRAPLKPYDGRSPELVKKLEGVVIHPDSHYPWQFCNLKTAMEFWKAPTAYSAPKSFKAAIQELSDTYHAVLH